MAKKICLHLVLILIAGGVIFTLTYFISYRLTANRYKTETTPPSRTAEAETNAADETQGDETTAAAETEVSAQEPEEAEDAVPYDATRLAEPRSVAMPEDDAWSLVLVNQFYRIRAGYEPFVEQVMEDSAVYLDQRVAEAFRAMYAAAMADGIELTLSAGYVTPDRQGRLFDKQVEVYADQGVPAEEAKARAAFFVLPAYCSESNYGLSVDIGWPEDDFAKSPAYGWLQQNAAKFGFVERYTADKTEITHFHPEPWHWRYVGAQSAAEMVEKNQCLEEYVGKVN